MGLIPRSLLRAGSFNYRMMRHFTFIAFVFLMQTTLFTQDVYEQVISNTDTPYKPYTLTGLTVRTCTVYAEVMPVAIQGQDNLFINAANDPIQVSMPMEGLKPAFTQETNTHLKFINYETAN